MYLINPSTICKFLLGVGVTFCIQSSYAGNQAYIPLSASVRALLHESVSDRTTRKSDFSSDDEASTWLNNKISQLQKRLPDQKRALALLRDIHYEASRAGLEPELVLGLIEVESGFKKYAVSNSGARGLMQVMPFWTSEIGTTNQNLFDLKTNLRYGCVILRYYLDLEKGNIFKALGRYNGSLGKPDYPVMVFAARDNHWATPPMRLARSK